MRLSVTINLAIFLFAFCTNIKRQIDGKFIIYPDGVDRVKIGDSVSRVYEKYKNTEIKISETTFQVEGEDTPVLEIKFHNKRFIAEIVDNNIWRIQVLTKGIQTKEGCGVGSTVAELQKSYGDYRTGYGEGGIYAVFEKAEGLSFELDVPVTGKINDKTAVGRILVVGN